MKFLSPVSTSTDQIPTRLTDEQQNPLPKKKKEKDKDSKELEKVQAAAPAVAHNTAKTSQRPTLQPNSEEFEAFQHSDSNPDQDSSEEKPSKVLNLSEHRKKKKRKKTPTHESSSFQVVKILDSNKRLMGQRAGVQAYKESLRKQRSSGRFRKGAILDTRNS